MRIPAALPLVLTFVCVLAAAAPALGEERRRPAPTDTPALAAEDFPALRPIAPVAQAAPTPSTSGADSVDERVLIVATYWLLIGGLALRRVTRRTREPVAPVAAWSFGHAPPLPR